MEWQVLRDSLREPEEAPKQVEVAKASTVVGDILSAALRLESKNQAL